MTVQDAILTPALQEIGVLSAIEAPDTTSAQFALTRLNQMLDTWNADRRMIYQIQQSVFTFNTSKQIWTMGPSGADFTALRPHKIQSANILIVGTGTAYGTDPGVQQVNVNWNKVADGYLFWNVNGTLIAQGAPWVTVNSQLVTGSAGLNTQKTRQGLLVLDDWERARVIVDQVPSSIPNLLYYDKAYPNINLYFWPYPNASNQFEVWYWAPLTQFATVSDAVSLPPGYAECMLYNLAERLSRPFGKAPDPLLQMSARRAFQRVMTNNADAPVLQPDTGLAPAQQPYFNYLTGE